MLIYVMGRGHSGSTILDVLLGSSPYITNVGELAAGLLMEQRGHLCSCGRPMNDCDFWNDVKRQFALRSNANWVSAATTLAAHTHIRHLPRTLFASKNSPAMVETASLMSAMVDAVAAASGKPHVVDASKEPTRGLFLLRFIPNTCIIHLVRDPRQLVFSHYRRFNNKGGYFHFLRRKYQAPGMLVPFMLLAAASWTVGNLICEAARRFRPTATLRVRYEDLCRNPAIELRRIAQALDISLEDVANRIEHDDCFSIGHNIGGNAMRHDGVVKFQPKQTNKHELPMWLVCSTVILCWPLMLLYGYRLKG